MKQCNSCGESKPLSEYYNHRKGRDGKYSFCRECACAKSKDSYRQDRAGALKRARTHCLKMRYGISDEQYAEMERKQNGCCAICGGLPIIGRSRRYLDVDHCHETGEVRGLLCHPCNTGLGGFRDNPDRMRKAIEYLECSKQGLSQSCYGTPVEPSKDSASMQAAA